MVMRGFGSLGWRFGEQLGRGGFGVVLEATCVCTGRPAVAKRALSGTSIPSLRKETELMLSLNHKNIIEVYDMFPDRSGRLWVIMERASGTLNQAVQEKGPWPDGFVARRGVELLSALKAVHNNGILHRDVHIDNVLMTYWIDGSEPSIKLSDFGIGKLLDDDYEGLAFTRIGRAYDMAPELIKYGYTSEQSDVYQAGLCMYYMATGRAAVGPADGTREEAISSGIARWRAERLGTPLGRIIAKMLRRRDEFLYMNAAEVLVDLQMFLMFKDV
jgi:serine/threonine-protein kinase